MYAPLMKRNDESIWKDKIDNFLINSSFFFKILFIYSTEIETASERGNTSRGSGRGRSRLIAEDPDVGLIPQRQDHALSRRQTPNRCATQVPQYF